MGKANYIPEEEEEDTLFDLSTADSFQPWLGIDHTNKAANKAKIVNKKTKKIFN